MSNEVERFLEEEYASQRIRRYVKVLKPVNHLLLGSLQSASVLRFAIWERGI